MQPAANPAPQTAGAVRAALLDYSKSPGKYQVAMRQPRFLFESLREVLQIASGRESDESGREAARFFTRTALLYPGADYYTLMGLDHRATGAEVKDRYRLMMRLLHPDFAESGPGAWPPDAAVRVNRAYDVLSTAVKRRDYDERLRPGQAPSSAKMTEPIRPGRVPVDDSARSRHTKIAIGCAIASAALLAFGLFTSGSSDPVHLVQRGHADTPPAARHVVLQSTPQLPPDAPETSAYLRSPEPEVLGPTTPAVQSPHSPMAAARPTRVLVSAPPMAPQTVPHPSASTRPGAPLMGQAVHPAPRFVLAEAPPLESKLDTAAITPPVVAAPIAPAPAPAASTQPTAVVAPPPVQVATAAAPAPIPAAAPARPALKAAPSLVEAQPLLSRLLQLMESGRGDRILNLLDAEARSKPAAQALSRQYDDIIDGARPVRLSHVEFKAEPGDGRLLVIGYFRVMAGEQTIGSLGRKMVLRAEFASREGNVVITGLSGGAVN